MTGSVGTLWLGRHGRSVPAAQDSAARRAISGELRTVRGRSGASARSGSRWRPAGWRPAVPCGLGRSPGSFGEPATCSTWTAAGQVHGHVTVGQTSATVAGWGEDERRGCQSRPSRESWPPSSRTSTSSSSRNVRTSTGVIGISLGDSGSSLVGRGWLLPATVWSMPALSNVSTGSTAARPSGTRLSFGVGEDVEDRSGSAGRWSGRGSMGAHDCPRRGLTEPPGSE
jgi:hypothetical protein